MRVTCEYCGSVVEKGLKKSEVTLFDIVDLRDLFPSIRSLEIEEKNLDWRTLEPHSCHLEGLINYKGDKQT